MDGTCPNREEAHRTPLPHLLPSDQNTPSPSTSEGHARLSLPEHRRRSGGLVRLCWATEVEDHKLGGQQSRRESASRGPVCKPAL